MKNIVEIRKIAKCLIIGMIALTLYAPADASAMENSPKEKQSIDTTNFNVVTGKVTNAITGEPIVFANVFIIDNRMGTVTNSDGEFLLKVPKSIKDPKFGVAHIGFKNAELRINEIRGNEIIVELAPLSVNLKEITVREADPIGLLREAVANIPENYSDQPHNAVGFYREWIKENRRYVSIAEAVLNVYKGAYTNDMDFDRAKIYKGRKSSDVKRMDTVLFKLQGGPYTSLLLDVVKNPAVLLSPEYMAYYDYKMGSIVKLNDVNCYTVEFEQKENIMYPLFSGKIYLEMENLAIAGLEFQLSESGLNNAGNLLVRKKPLTMKVEPESGNYFISYRVIDDKWHLSYVRSEVKFRCKWDKKLFYTDLTIMAEMAVTDWRKDNITKVKFSESTKKTDVLAENVTYFEDPNFWGEYNTIKPEESLETAIEKFNKKIKKLEE